MSKSDPTGLHKVREYNPDRLRMKLFRQQYFSTSGAIGPYKWCLRKRNQNIWPPLLVDVTLTRPRRNVGNAQGDVRARANQYFPRLRNKKSRCHSKYANKRIELFIEICERKLKKGKRKTCDVSNTGTLSIYRFVLNFVEKSQRARMYRHLNAVVSSIVRPRKVWV